jgi:hypothetical protein
MPTYSKKSSREREIIKRLDDEISEMRKKTTRFQDDNPRAQFDTEVTNLSEIIHSGILPNIKKPTIH